MTTFLFRCCNNISSRVLAIFTSLFCVCVAPHGASGARSNFPAGCLCECCTRVNPIVRYPDLLSYREKGDPQNALYIQFIWLCSDCERILWPARAISL